MENRELAEALVEACFAGGGATDPGRELAERLEDGRKVVVATGPGGGSAVLAVELALGGLEKTGDGEVELAMLRANWEDRLGRGFVVAREDDGRDVLALLVHRATATVEALAEDLDVLIAVAENPQAGVPTDTAASLQPQAGWVSV